MRYTRLMVMAVLIALFGCGEKKSAGTRQWYKGNLHTHSYWSDGDEFPEVTVLKHDRYNTHPEVHMSTLPRTALATVLGMPAPDDCATANGPEPAARRSKPAAYRVDASS